jgi:hypothetical protein
MDINKHYNKNKRQINHKYNIIYKEIKEGVDLSEIIYEITGFADKTRFGVTERENIVCIDKNKNYRKLIQYIMDDTDDTIEEEEYKPPSKQIVTTEHIDFDYNCLSTHIINKQIQKIERFTEKKIYKRCKNRKVKNREQNKKRYSEYNNYTGSLTNACHRCDYETIDKLVYLPRGFDQKPICVHCYGEIRDLYRD